MPYHGEIVVQQIDKLTLPLVWAEFKRKCKEEWRLNNKDCKKIEVYYHENNEEIILKKVENENN